jgi:hypothetical protein
VVVAVSTTLPAARSNTCHSALTDMSPFSPATDEQRLNSAGRSVTPTR